MIPLARRIARAGRGELAVYRLLNTYRGWDTAHTPVDDALWALGQLEGELGPLPVCLVGHSLGGRAAVLAGTHPQVSGVVALNAWTYGNEHVRLPGRRVLFAHGDEDRIAPLERALKVASSLGRSARVTFTVVNGGKHAMIRSSRSFERLTIDFVTGALLGPAPAGTGAEEDNGVEAARPAPGFAIEHA
ncbi:pimeloyl-ACP methyl ester carboxylesterase [Nocardioides thalensis]|uniref:Pimeloyl-ACP methyl ester carboxylesterase n=1 Tax=Nocardioides thalensis TaxID=1914755 RepID=A0A853C7P2_9ACTN|nr:pimeloyl-ACP methyl ester carboxylesterase [Nocardioides thalensis]